MQQCDKYLYADTIELNETQTVRKSKLVPYICVIDTECVYLYDGKCIKQIFSLDDLTEVERIAELKRKLKEAMS